MRDAINTSLVKWVISPVSVGDNTAQVGQIIDRAGFNSLSYVILTGSLADADATFACFSSTAIRRTYPMQRPCQTRT